MVMIELPEWLPDRADVSTPGVPVARNLLPTADGYKSIRDLSAIDVTPLPGFCNGAFRGRTQDGASFFMAGTVGDLYDIVDNDWREITRTAGYTMGLEDHWEFEIYGNRKFATNYIEQVQTMEDPDTEMEDLNVAAEAQQAGNGNASRAAVIAVVGEFVVLGDIVGQNDNAAAIGSQEAGLHWCAIGNSLLWPEVGTQTAVDTQSDFQVLQGDGGPIISTIPAAEWTAVFRSRQIYRMDYIGAPAVFAFRKADDQRGATVPGTAVAVGGLVYFLSEEGFMVFNGAQIAPIGHEKVDSTVMDRIDWVRAAARCSAVHDPDTRSIVWALPVQGGGSLILGYQYELQKFWNIEKSVDRLVTYLPTAGGADSLDGVNYDDMWMDHFNEASDPAPTPNLANTNMDTIGAGAAGREVLAAFAADSHQLSSFGAENFISGVIEAGDFEIADGKRGILQWVRPVFKGDGNMTLAVNTGFTPEKDLSTFGYRFPKGALINDAGVCPYRVGGRYMRAQFTTSGEINQFQGFDFRSAPAGDR
jgi:hypothetical protein